MQESFVLRAASRLEWRSNGYPPNEAIGVGCLQRIADSLEAICDYLDGINTSLDPRLKKERDDKREKQDGWESRRKARSEARNDAAERWKLELPADVRQKCRYKVYRIAKRASEYFSPEELASCTWANRDEWFDNIYPLKLWTRLRSEIEQETQQAKAGQ